MRSEVDGCSDVTHSRPPHPQFALSVGVIGHRPDRLAAVKLDKITQDVGDVLDAVSAAARHVHHDRGKLFARSEPVLTLVSALAEGADTIAAKAALKRGFKLDVPMPFAVESYKRDFNHDPHNRDDPADVMKAERQTRQALEDFDGLLNQARSVFELPGERRRKDNPSTEARVKENRAYESAGLTVLSQADIILAVWDGGPSHGRGGTPELIAEAARAGMPVVVVDAKGEKPPVVCWRNLMKTPAPIVAIEDLPSVGIEKGMTQVVDELVRLPAAPEQQHAFWKWFDERDHTINLRFGFPLLMMLALVRLFRATDLFPRPRHAMVAEFEDPVRRLRLSSTTVKTTAASAHGLAAAYGWADAVAIWCAQIFRGAFVMNFLFAAFAVFAAATGVVFLQGEAHPVAGWRAYVPTGIVGFEIFLIVSVIVNTRAGHTRRWHSRWFEAREMAERLRIALPLWVLGLRPGTFPGEEATWTGWYVRALVRAQGLRSGDLAGEQFRAARDVLLDVLRGQCGYHIGNAHRMERLEQRLEWAGFALLILTVVVAADHFLTPLMAVDHAIHSYLVAKFLHMFGMQDLAHSVAVGLGAALPALATATYGIRVIGDLEGTARRSERTHKGLDQVIKAIETEDNEDITLLRARARAAADIMLGDVSSWRLSAESRGLAIPG